MKKTMFIFSLCLSFCLNAEGNYQSGQEKSTLCAACHGPKGVSTNPLWPSLAGQHEGYLKKQLLDFKDNKKRPPPQWGQLLQI